MLVPEGQQYPTFERLRVGDAEFFSPAVRVATRLDTCFGAFIRHLKAAGLYDDSIIILTSESTATRTARGTAGGTPSFSCRSGCAFR